PVQFGQDNTRDVNDFGEHASLVHAVLAGGRVQHEEHFADRHLFLDDAFDLAELVHQPRFSVQAPRGVDKHRIGAVVERLFYGIEGHTGRIRAHVSPDDRYVHTFPPGLQLFGRRCPERVGDAQYDAAVLGCNNSCEQTHRGGLTGAVDAHYQDDAGLTVIADGAQAALEIVADRSHKFFAQQPARRGFVRNTFDTHTGSQPLNQFLGGGKPEIGAEESILDLFPCVIVESVATEHSQ